MAAAESRLVEGRMRDKPHFDAIVELYQVDPNYMFELLNDVEGSGAG